MAFSTLINYLRKLFEIFKGYFQTCTSQNTTGKYLKEKVDPKFLIKKGEEWYIDNENNIKKLLQSRLLDFSLFHIKGNQRNP